MLNARSEPLVLRAAVDNYGHTRDLKDGTVTSPRLRFEFADVKPMNRAFKPMMEELAFDVSEMAIVTFLQGRADGKPVALVPVVLLNRFHHGSIVVTTKSPVTEPRQLNGKRVGVRAYTQTTAVWVRGILASDYGVDNDSITWVTNEGAHIVSYVDPPIVERLAPGSPSLVDLLKGGEIDAWVGGREAAAIEGVRPIINDIAAAERAWFKRVGALPINHMLVVKRQLIDEHPWLLETIFTMFRTSKENYFARLKSAGAKNAEETFHLDLLNRGIDPLPSGVEALRRSLEVVIDYAAAQHLIPNRPTVDELFDPRALALGSV